MFSQNPFSQTTSSQTTSSQTMSNRTHLRQTSLIALFLLLAFSLASADSSSLSAAAIVDRNVAARGGLQAWRNVKTMKMTGKMDAGGNNRPTLAFSSPGAKKGAAMPPPRPTAQVQLPFVMELQRPRKTRLEIEFKNQKAIQVFDGSNGWKLRPFLNRHEVENYTPDELKATALQADLDGPLVDYAAKGTKVELDGREKVGDQDTYKLKLTLKNGQAQHIWIDSKTFLEVKIEGTPRRLDGKMRNVATYLRDYRVVSGLVVPHLLETIVEGYKDAVEKIQIETVVVNPTLEEIAFAKPK